MVIKVMDIDYNNNIIIKALLFVMLRNNYMKYKVTKFVRLQTNYLPVRLRIHKITKYYAIILRVNLRFCKFCVRLRRNISELLHFRKITVEIFCNYYGP